MNRYNEKMAILQRDIEYSEMKVNQLMSNIADLMLRIERSKNEVNQILKQRGEQPIYTINK